ncbi:hypothetical protein, partial [Amycolatopsis japonica]
YYRQAKNLAGSFVGRTGAQLSDREERRVVLATEGFVGRYNAATGEGPTLKIEIKGKPTDGEARKDRMKAVVEEVLKAVPGGEQIMRDHVWIEWDQNSVLPAGKDFLVREKVPGEQDQPPIITKKKRKATAPPPGPEQEPKMEQAHAVSPTTREGSSETSESDDLVKLTHAVRPRVQAGARRRKGRRDAAEVDWWSVKPPETGPLELSGWDKARLGALADRLLERSPVAEGKLWDIRFHVTETVGHLLSYAGTWFELMEEELKAALIDRGVPEDSEMLLYGFGRLEHRVKSDRGRHPSVDIVVHETSGKTIHDYRNAQSLDLDFQPYRENLLELSRWGLIWRVESLADIVKANAGDRSRLVLDLRTIEAKRSAHVKAVTQAVNVAVRRAYPEASKEEIKAFIDKRIEFLYSISWLNKPGLFVDVVDSVEPAAPEPDATEAEGEASNSRAGGDRSDDGGRALSPAGEVPPSLEAPEVFREEDPGGGRMSDVYEPLDELPWVEQGLGELPEGMEPFDVERAGGEWPQDWVAQYFEDTDPDSGGVGDPMSDVVAGGVELSGVESVPPSPVGRVAGASFPSSPVGEEPQVLEVPEVHREEEPGGGLMPDVDEPPDELPEDWVARYYDDTDPDSGGVGDPVPLSEVVAGGIELSDVEFVPLKRGGRVVGAHFPLAPGESEVVQSAFEAGAGKPGVYSLVGHGGDGGFWVRRRSDGRAVKLDEAGVWQLFRSLWLPDGGLWPQEVPDVVIVSCGVDNPAAGGLLDKVRMVALDDDYRGELSGPVGRVRVWEDGIEEIQARPDELSRRPEGGVGEHNGVRYVDLATSGGQERPDPMGQQEPERPHSDTAPTPGEAGKTTQWLLKIAKSARRDAEVVDRWHAEPPASGVPELSEDDKKSMADFAARLFEREPPKGGVPWDIQVHVTETRAHSNDYLDEWFELLENELKAALIALGVAEDSELLRFDFDHIEHRAKPTKEIFPSVDIFVHDSTGQMIQEYQNAQSLELLFLPSRDDLVASSRRKLHWRLEGLARVADRDETDQSLLTLKLNATEKLYAGWAASAAAEVKAGAAKAYPGRSDGEIAAFIQNRTEFIHRTSDMRRGLFVDLKQSAEESVDLPEADASLAQETTQWLLKVAKTARRDAEVVDRWHAEPPASGVPELSKDDKKSMADFAARLLEREPPKGGVPWDIQVHFTEADYRLKNHAKTWFKLLEDELKAALIALGVAEDSELLRFDFDHIEHQIRKTENLIPSVDIFVHDTTGQMIQEYQNAQSLELLFLPRRYDLVASSRRKLHWRVVELARAADGVEGDQSQLALKVRGTARRHEGLGKSVTEGMEKAVRKADLGKSDAEIKAFIGERTEFTYVIANLLSDLYVELVEKPAVGHLSSVSSKSATMFSEDKKNITSFGLRLGKNVVARPAGWEGPDVRITVQLESGWDDKNVQQVVRNYLLGGALGDGMQEAGMTEPEVQRFPFTWFWKSGGDGYAGRVSMQVHVPRGEPQGGRELEYYRQNKMLAGKFVHSNGALLPEVVARRVALAAEGFFDRLIAATGEWPNLEVDIKGNPRVGLTRQELLKKVVREALVARRAGNAAPWVELPEIRDIMRYTRIEWDRNAALPAGADFLVRETDPGKESVPRPAPDVTETESAVPMEGTGGDRSDDGGGRAWSPVAEEPEAPEVFWEEEPGGGLMPDVDEPLDELPWVVQEGGELPEGMEPFDGEQMGSEWPENWVARYFEDTGPDAEEVGDPVSMSDVVMGGIDPTDVEFGASTHDLGEVRTFFPLDQAEAEVMWSGFEVGADAPYADPATQGQASVEGTGGARDDRSATKNLAGTETEQGSFTEAGHRSDEPSDSPGFELEAVAGSDFVLPDDADLAVWSEVLREAVGEEAVSSPSVEWARREAERLVRGVPSVLSSVDVDELQFLHNGLVSVLTDLIAGGMEPAKAWENADVAGLRDELERLRGPVGEAHYTLSVGEIPGWSPEPEAALDLGAAAERAMKKWRGRIMRAAGRVDEAEKTPGTAA